MLVRVALAYANGTTLILSGQSLAEWEAEIEQGRMLVRLFRDQAASPRASTEMDDEPPPTLREALGRRDE